MQRWIMVTLVGIAILLGVSVLVMQINEKTDAAKNGGKQEAAATLPDTPINADAATATIKQSCVACHGNDLEGKMGPNLQKTGSKLTAEQIYKIVANGKGTMPGFKSTLKDDEVVNVSKWLAEKK